jgi:hypothetical protein
LAPGVGPEAVCRDTPKHGGKHGKKTQIQSKQHGKNMEKTMEKRKPSQIHWIHLAQKNRAQQISAT